MFKKILRFPFEHFINKFREQRKNLLRDQFDLEEPELKADLGGFDGSHFARLVDDKFYLLEPSLSGIKQVDSEKIIPVQIDEDCKIPIKDNALDFLFCNSVIEHATGPKNEQAQEKDGEKFTEIAWNYQKSLASEIQRVSKSYWVQTPNYHFPLETHIWLPFVQYLPRNFLVALVKSLDYWWIKSTSGDINLLTKKQMRELFPTAEILTTSFFGMSKSLIACEINSDSNEL